jgi:tetratricopeptide (TPR) repeat protein
MTVGLPARLMAQGDATIHGHVTNPAGQPLTVGTVQLTTDKNASTPNRKFEYTFPLDANGDYKGSGIKPANYIGVVMQGPKTVDFLPAPIAAGEDKTLDFDMTRKEYIDKMSPADREQLEEYKKTVAAALAANTKIESLNGLLKEAYAEITAGHYDQAAKAMTEATTVKPDEPILWLTLGNAQLGIADSAAKAAAAAKATDASLPDKYAAAIASFQKAVAVNAASAKFSVDTAGAANNQIGQAYGKLALGGQPDKLKDSRDGYEAAAKADPTKAGMYYFNEAATMYNISVKTGNVDGLSDVADKAIAADPTKAMAYYIKSQALAPLITTTPDGKFVAPPGFVEACNKYLELAPTGPYAADLKSLLSSLGDQVKLTYKAPKK